MHNLYKTWWSVWKIHTQTAALTELSQKSYFDFLFGFSPCVLRVRTASCTEQLESNLCMCVCVFVLFKALQSDNK